MSVEVLGGRWALSQGHLCLSWYECEGRGSQVMDKEGGRQHGVWPCWVSWATWDGIGGGHSAHWCLNLSVALGQWGQQEGWHSGSSGNSSPGKKAPAHTGGGIRKDVQEEEAKRSPRAVSHYIVSTVLAFHSDHLKLPYLFSNLRLPSTHSLLHSVDDLLQFLSGGDKRNLSFLTPFF